MGADGKWEISMNTPMGAQAGTLDLKEDGNALTGTMSAAAAPEAMEITDGTVDGDNLTWKAALTQPMPITLEFAARHARRYAAVGAFSGGLIGPPGTARAYPGSFDGTPVFIGCSDVDPHIPVERVRESAEVYRGLGASVDERIYKGMGHTINQAEIDAVRNLLKKPAL